MRVAKEDPQGAGSALTYARRYALGCMTGLVTELDDDGNAASHAPAGKTYAANRPSLPPHPVLAPVVPPAPSQAPSEGTLAPGSAWVVPFGKTKGQRVCDIADNDLDWLCNYYVGKTKDPANATSRFRDEWEEALLNIRAEQLQRYPDPTQEA